MTIGQQDMLVLIQQQQQQQQLLNLIPLGEVGHMSPPTP